MKFRARNAIGAGLSVLVLSGLSWGRCIAEARKAPPQSAVAPAESKTDPAPANKPHDDSYVIGNDDVLAINVWKEVDLTRSVPVRSDGKISLPLVGEVQATGKTPSQLEQSLTERLKSYVTDPEVTVMVEQVKSKKVNILGQVGKPGSYALSLAPTIVDAIAAAGGFKEFAKQKGVYVLRKSQDGKETRIPFNYKSFIKGQGSAVNVPLESGDTVIVP